MKKFLLLLIVCFSYIYAENWEVIKKNYDSMEIKDLKILKNEVLFDLKNINHKQILAEKQKSVIPKDEYFKIFDFFKKRKLFETPIITKKITSPIFPELNFYYFEELRFGVDPPTPVFITVFKKKVLRFKLRDLELADVLFRSVRKIDMDNFNKIIRFYKLSVMNEIDALNICRFFLKIALDIDSYVLFKNDVNADNNLIIFEDPCYVCYPNGYKLHFFTRNGFIREWTFFVKKNGEIEIISYQGR